jgi:hypothetical protein
MVGRWPTQWGKTLTPMFLKYALLIFVPTAIGMVASLHESGFAAAPTMKILG